MIRASSGVANYEHNYQSLVESEKRGNSKELKPYREKLLTQEAYAIAQYGMVKVKPFTYTKEDVSSDKTMRELQPISDVAMTIAPVPSASKIKVASFVYRGITKSVSYLGKGFKGSQSVNTVVTTKNVFAVNKGLETAKEGQKVHKKWQRAWENVNRGFDNEVTISLSNNKKIRKDIRTPHGKYVIGKPSTVSGVSSANRRDKLLANDGFSRNQYSTFFYNPKNSNEGLWLLGSTKNKFGYNPNAIRFKIESNKMYYAKEKLDLPDKQTAKNIANQLNNTFSKKMEKIKEVNLSKKANKVSKKSQKQEKVANLLGINQSTNQLDAKDNKENVSSASKGSKSGSSSHSSSTSRTLGSSEHSNSKSSKSSSSSRSSSKGSKSGSSSRSSSKGSESGSSSRSSSKGSESGSSSRSSSKGSKSGSSSRSSSKGSKSGSSNRSKK